MPDPQVDNQDEEGGRLTAGQVILVILVILLVIVYFTVSTMGIIRWTVNTRVAQIKGPDGTDCQGSGSMMFWMFWKMVLNNILVGIPGMCYYFCGSNHLACPSS